VVLECRSCQVTGTPLRVASRRAKSLVVLDERSHVHLAVAKLAHQGAARTATRARHENHRCSIQFVTVGSVNFRSLQGPVFSRGCCTAQA